MKLRSGRTTAATPPSFGDGDSDGIGKDMNASLWGELQSFVDLSLIYAKLPLVPFFRLRQVCKEWNRFGSPISGTTLPTSDFQPVLRGCLRMIVLSWRWRRTQPKFPMEFGFLLPADTEPICTIRVAVLGRFQRGSMCCSGPGPGRGTGPKICMIGR